MSTRAATGDIVFVPAVGFRPAGTRVLREQSDTTQEGTRLIVLAAAAAPERTDVVIEWERSDPASCAPDSQLLVHSNMRPLEHGLTAELVTDGVVLAAAAMHRRFFHFGASAGAIDAITFPAIPDEADSVELRVAEGSTMWRVPLALGAGGANAAAIDVATTKHGVTVRTTGVSRHDNELIVDVEVTAPLRIRQVGAPVPVAQRHRDLSDEDLRMRKAEMYRLFGDRARPITLDDERGASREEDRRLFTPEPQERDDGSYASRFIVVFPDLDADTQRASLVIPFIELVDLAASATVNLSALPVDVVLGDHRLRVVAIEPHGADQQKVVIELPGPPSSPSVTRPGPRVVQPARMQGSDAEFAWQRQDADRPGRDAILMATKIGEPPIVTFTGVVLRVEGPIRLDLPLAAVRR
ncbi:MAG TPA: hypothetical protein VM052_02605 [Candidatus Limnocylindrales bacterium]|nr:hypothetical protein [Candidatus Limnocylindrales bacterium]